MSKVPEGLALVERMVEDARKRRIRALKLRQSGLTMQQVGDRLGISKQRAAELIYRAQREAQST